MTSSTAEEPSKAVTNLEASCIQRLLTGFAGALVILVGAVFLSIIRALFHPATSAKAGYVALLLVTFVTMAFIEIFIFRVYRVQFDFSLPRKIDFEGLHAIAHRLFAVIVTLGGAWMLYWVLGEYGLRFTGVFRPHLEDSWYRPFFLLFCAMTILLPVLAVPYFYLCERFGRWDRESDEMLKLWAGYVALSRFKHPGDGFGAAVRSLCVKFFFVPLMTVFFVNNAQAFEMNLLRVLAGPWVWDVEFAGRLYRALYEGLYLVDVNLALLGYVCCFRFLDTHIRSAEPTLFGWLVALACYPPFNARITGLYLPHDPNVQTWDTVLSAWPWVYYLVGALILLLLWVYLYATIAFGFRFSNLTHRGIICRGPYRWVRHPAYAAKNLSWWLISLPFLSSPAACMRLVFLNLLYFCRAITEERHLRRDPVYRAYMEKVKWRFIPGVL
jgi:protein-S-isoprenylcysteine O-methyltransferase Ste14